MSKQILERFILAIHQNNYDNKIPIFLAKVIKKASEAYLASFNKKLFFLLKISVKSDMGNDVWGDLFDTFSYHPR